MKKITTLDEFNWDESPDQVQSRYPASFVIRRRPLGETLVVPRFLQPEEDVSVTAEIEFEGPRIAHVSLKPMPESRPENWAETRSRLAKHLQAQLNHIEDLEFEVEEEWDDFAIVVSR